MGRLVQNIVRIVHVFEVTIIVVQVVITTKLHGLQKLFRNVTTTLTRDFALLNSLAVSSFNALSYLSNELYYCDFVDYIQV